MLDILIEADRERLTVTGNTPDGEAFIDAWLGAILEVVDSGCIVIPREATPDFTNAADQQGLVVAVTYLDGAAT